MSTKPRLRFAPSPTGDMHIGNARAALFNYLYAHNVGGTFLLRIEDTDIDRSKDEFIDGIVAKLEWLNINWDEPIVKQSAKFDRYLECVNALVEKGYAYECYETPEELEEINKERIAKKLPPGYDGRAKNLSFEEKQKFREENRPVTIRFSTPSEGTSSFKDLIRGEVTVRWEGISDFIIYRSNGTPTFFLANAIDDCDMNITHVFRGEDLIDTTHRIIALRKALCEIGCVDKEHINQQYAHLPLILSTDRAKLSKRHGAVSIDDLRDLGFISKALVNYIVLLGWSHPDQKEILSIDEIIKDFTVDRINNSSAVFDKHKLEWLNGEYIKLFSNKELFDEVEDYSSRLKSNDKTYFYFQLEKDLKEKILDLAKPRVNTLLQIIESAEFLGFDDEQISYDATAWEKFSNTENIKLILDETIKHITNCEWTLEDIDLRPVCQSIEIKPKKALPVLYTALQGIDRGLPLFDSILLLGREKTLKRLEVAKKLLG